MGDLDGTLRCSRPAKPATQRPALLYHQRRKQNSTMGVKSDKDLGINSWLEDELYQEYLHDRAAVDESWKHVFDDARGGNGRPVAPVEAGNAAPAAEKPAGGEAAAPVTMPGSGPVTAPVTAP